MTHPMEHLAPERRRQLQELARRLEYRFQELGLLDQALRHSSFAHENPEAGPSNEQLEFLGDAVLALAVSHLLLARYPQASEGELSRQRAAMVNAHHLGRLARQLDLGNHLLLGRGETRQAGWDKPSLLADALEAVLAAVFLDGGWEAAEKMVQRWFEPILAHPAELSPPDWKTLLQEVTQARFKLSPRYHLLEESGPSHARHFLMEVRLGDRPLAQGEGHTKKQAAQMAARRALLAVQEGIESELPENE